MAYDVSNANIAHTIRSYIPSPLYNKLYAMKHNEFLSCLTCVYSFCPYGKWLFTTLPIVINIYTQEEIEAQCRSIAQDIFTYYKNDKKKDSLAARQALARIYEATKYLISEDLSKKIRIEEVLKGLGDDKWRL